MLLVFILNQVLEYLLDVIDIFASLVFIILASTTLVLTYLVSLILGELRLLMGVEYLLEGVGLA